MNKWVIIGVVLVVVLFIIAILIPQKEDVPFQENLLGISYDIEGNETSLSYKSDNPIVAMKVKGYGSIVMELYPDIAPNTVNNFISLVKSGFYDNNNFHRLVKGFVLQGGDPEGTGSGGPGYSIKGEFTSNDFENNLKHEKGILSMARANDPDSAGSQFFIMLGKADWLDDNYAAFGKLIDGYDIIEAIEENEKVADQDSGKLAKNIVIEKAVIDLKGKEYPEPEKIGE